MKNNWLWREYMQKAALDLYTQKNAQQQVAPAPRVRPGDERENAGRHQHRLQRLVTGKVQ